MYLIFYRKVSVKSQNKTRWVPMALCPRAEAATALPGSSRARTGQALMLNGIVKAAVIVGIAVMRMRRPPAEAPQGWSPPAEPMAEEPVEGGSP